MKHTNEDLRDAEVSLAHDKAKMYRSIASLISAVETIIYDLTKPYRVKAEQEYDIARDTKISNSIKRSVERQPSARNVR